MFFNRVEPVDEEVSSTAEPEPIDVHQLLTTGGGRQKRLH